MQNTTIAPFTFRKSTYSDLVSLVNDMGKYWQDGKKLLFGDQLKEHTKKSAPSFSNTCAGAAKEYSDLPNEGNQIFLKWLCKCPQIRRLYWKGHDYGGIKEIYTTLSGPGDDTLNSLLLHAIGRQYFSRFIKNIGCEDILVERIKFLERSFNKTDSKFNKANVLTMLRVFLSGDTTLDFAGRSFATPADLAAFLQGYADISKDALSRVSQPLFQDDYNLDPHFEAWVVMHGFQHELTLWKGKFQEGQGPVNDIDIFPLDDGQEVIEEGQHQENAVFAASIEGFEDKFYELMDQYTDRLDDSVAFNALVSDYFPLHRLQAFLIVALYRMDIMKAIREAPELTDFITARFEKRLVTDYGIKEPFAKWAVYEWCHCYGERILQKSSIMTPIKL